MSAISVRSIGASTWTELPEPDYKGGLTWSLQDVDASTSGRDQQGYMHRDRVSKKRKLTCTWTNRSASDIHTILNSAIKDVFFECKFFDYETNSMVIKTMYVGDRTAPVYSTVLGQNHNETIISNFTANFIER